MVSIPGIILKGKSSTFERELGEVRVEVLLLRAEPIYCLKLFKGAEQRVRAIRNNIFIEEKLKRSGK